MLLKAAKLNLKMVVVYEPRDNNPERELHAVYVKNCKSGILSCVNSWAETEAEINIRKEDVRYLYYVSVRQVVGA